ncbi:hypothetical protein [Mesorhizobium shangrilense]|uniref:Uncharacterized protein n=1 Tax=Mesorhizobium shangrilense TaxID=460060 RepID=A0ABV2DII9_9HYPH
MTDRLLEWMSFRRTGRLSDVPADLADAGAVRRTVDNLATLGHLEVLPNSNWRIAPPVLAGLPERADGLVSAVLCGARTPSVFDSLARAGAQLAINTTGTRPAVVRLTGASNGELAAVAAAAGIPLQIDAALTLLACTPTIRDWPRIPCQMVGGRVETVLRFSRSRIGWVESTIGEASAAQSGFFRIKRDWDWVSLLKMDVSDCAYIDDRAGRLAAVAKLKAVSWSSASETLDLPGQLLPPAPIARALALCSGALPHYDVAARRISFTGIPLEILRLTLAITGLRLA